MESSFRDILNPVGEPAAARRPAAAAAKGGRARPVIGLLNNSKPNVSFFLAAVEQALRSRGRQYEIFSIIKPRSAGACPDIEGLAGRCDYVINAVAD